MTSAISTMSSFVQKRAISKTTTMYTVFVKGRD